MLLLIYLGLVKFLVIIFVVSVFRATKWTTSTSSTRCGATFTRPTAWTSAKLASTSRSDFLEQAPDALFLCNLANFPLNEGLLRFGTYLNPALYIFQRRATLLASFPLFFDFQNEVRKIRVSKRENFTVNRLNKTKREVKNPDLRGEREQRDRQVKMFDNLTLFRDLKVQSSCGAGRKKYSRFSLFV